MGRASDRNPQLFQVLLLVVCAARSFSAVPSLTLPLFLSSSSFFAALFIVLARDSVDPAFAGAALNFALSTGGIIGFSIILATEMEVKMNGVERVRRYTSPRMKREPEWHVEDADKALKDKAWPTQGAVEFRNVTMRYRKGLEPALKGLSATIKPGSNVGVVGRTGSGKSTLMLTLFRMYNIEKEGAILIDGEDIASMGLHALRSRIAVC